MKKQIADVLIHKKDLSKDSRELLAYLLTIDDIEDRIIEVLISLNKFRVEVTEHINLQKVINEGGFIKKLKTTTQE